MKLWITVAAVALIGTGAFATGSALAQGNGKEPPHLLSAPKSGLMKNSKAGKSRSFTLEAKAGPTLSTMTPPAATTDAKTSK